MRYKISNGHLLGIVLLFVIVLSGCVPKVLVPPRVDLKSYGKIGVFTFTCDARGKLGRLATQRFIETILYLQPGVQIIELGKTSEDLTVQQLKEIKQENGLDGVITGILKVSNVKPKIDISALLSSMTVQANVEANLTVKLYQTEGGLTLWTRSGYANQNVAQVTIMKGRGTSFEANDPENAYGALVNNLINQVSHDLRSTWVKKGKRG